MNLKQPIPQPSLKQSCDSRAPAAGQKAQGNSPESEKEPEAKEEAQGIRALKGMRPQRKQDETMQEDWVKQKA
jgi:hypothetical protein